MSGQQFSFTYSVWLSALPIRSAWPLFKKKGVREGCILSPVLFNLSKLCKSWGTYVRRYVRYELFPRIDNGRGPIDHRCGSQRWDLWLKHDRFNTAVALVSQTGAGCFLDEGV